MRHALVPIQLISHARPATPAQALTDAPPDDPPDEPKRRRVPRRRRATVARRARTA